MRDDGEDPERRRALLIAAQEARLAISLTHHFDQMREEVEYLNECAGHRHDLPTFQHMRRRLQGMQDELANVASSTMPNDDPKQMATHYGRAMMKWQEVLTHTREALENDGVVHADRLYEAAACALSNWQRIHRTMSEELGVEPAAHTRRELTQQRESKARGTFLHSADRFYAALTMLQDEMPGFDAFLRKVRPVQMQRTPQDSQSVSEQVAAKLREINALYLPGDESARNGENTTFPDREHMDRYGKAIVAAHNILVMAEKVMPGAARGDMAEYRRRTTKLDKAVRDAAYIFSQIDVEQRDTNVYLLAHWGKGR